MDYSMKSLKLFSLLFLLTACGSGTPEYDATGTFEATDVIVSAEASGKILGLDVEEGTLLKAGQEVGIIDTVQLYLKKLQLEASVKSVEGQRPDILKQVAATKEQIVQAQRERDVRLTCFASVQPTGSSGRMRNPCLKYFASNLQPRTPRCRTVTGA